MTEITDADRIMLNPDYIKKIEQQNLIEQQQQQQELEQTLQIQSDEIPDYVKDELTKQLEDPLNSINNDFVKQAVQYISDPMNSKDYYNYVVLGVGKYNDAEYGKVDSKHPFTIHIPILFGTF